jgi:hypothetical protein
LYDDIRRLSAVSGQIIGPVGNQSVVIENFVVYAHGPEKPSGESDVSKPIAPSPYPGLAYFGPDDTAWFFGRDEAVQKLTAAVTRQSDGSGWSLWKR